MKIITVEYDGKSILALESETEPTLQEKYANYKGTPASYRKPDDLNAWSNRRPTGKELW
ncbi:hypothetical protein [Lentilactobacillus parakefiri]|uniref:Uncharacterized protein n=1 Tax=Lentilactobacillus parakefiri TaxID=152332 RepID=A0A224VIY8_9LACO|nr:hypothetical protein [Lentilactobacillus parakefiri]KRL70916.1 hypothetical protein FD08_GL000936 [Lentilactobacillus parakefiri DSM 10551]TDG94563.1 hypothetical protein C5L28_000820 [Lentilactobacillus parakefiri]GAW72190.1 hypothetical protein LPKJCM_01300 [Lentilactobacillus parakefiri]